MRKTLVKIASLLFPEIMVQKAYKALTNPQIKKLRAHEIAVLNEAHKSKFPFKGFDIQLYHWKGGEKSVLLIHGWEGQAGNFSDLIQKLQENNYTIYAFDGPSHGFSSIGATSMFEFIELIEVLIKKFQVTQLVSHSFGGVATTFSLANNPDITIKKYALLTTPDRFSQRIDVVAKQVGITEKVKRKLIYKLEQETDSSVASMNVSDFVQRIAIEQVYIIHDKADKVIPITQAKNVADNWKNSTFEAIEGTGHFRILRTDRVLEKVIAFLD